MNLSIKILCHCPARPDNPEPFKKLDSPIKRLCHNVILRPKPKNLGFTTH